MIHIPTAIQGVELRQLAAADAQAFYDLVQSSRAFLTRYGDYQDIVDSSLADIAASLSALPDDYLGMGIWRGDEFMGQVDLNPVAPGELVLGYWLGEAYTGQGIMSAACQALIDYALQALPVTAFWAGVRHANHQSAAVVERLGFTVYEELPDRKRYRKLV